MIASLVISFTEWTVVTRPKFVGTANFSRMFTQDPLFWKSLYVTAYYTFLSVPLVIVSAFLVATLLNQQVKGLAVFRTVFYLPSVVPAVANAVLWLWLFNPDFGLLNTMLGKIGIGKLLGYMMKHRSCRHLPDERMGYGQYYDHLCRTAGSAQTALSSG